MACGAFELCGLEFQKDTTMTVDLDAGIIFDLRYFRYVWVGILDVRHYRSGRGWWYHFRST